MNLDHYLFTGSSAIDRQSFIDMLALGEDWGNKRQGTWLKQGADAFELIKMPVEGEDVPEFEGIHDGEASAL